MSEELSWISTESGYDLALRAGKLVCRNAKGAELKSVAKAAKATPEAEELLALRDWLVSHEAECKDTVDTWMQRSLPVPRPLLLSVWRDPSWRSVLENCVIRGAEDECGFLRGVDKTKGIGIVNLDGETEWLSCNALYILHPILIEELAEFRELATELGIEQTVSQLFRETWQTPTDLDEGSTAVSEFQGGKFEQLNHVLGKCRTLGYRVRGGFATCTVWEAGKSVQASYWIGAESPEYETYTGDLSWVDDKEHAIKIEDVGPVAFSEGMRMASAIYGARYIEKEGE